jgi:hypothetical protein
VHEKFTLRPPPFNAHSSEIQETEVLINGDYRVRREKRTVVAQGNGWKVTIEGVSGSGKSINYSCTTNYDG